jgi:hypothetical protein
VLRSASGATIVIARFTVVVALARDRIAAASREATGVTCVDDDRADLSALGHEIQQARDLDVAGSIRSRGR